MNEYIIEYMSNLWHLTLEMAPWLLFGLIVAGLLKTLLPTEAVARWLGGRGAGSVVTAAIIGTPIPVCSCGVLPLALGIRRQGASRGATISFLLATPQNGADSIAVSYALLGPFMTVLRPVAAFVTAVTTGIAAQFVREPEVAKPTGATSDGAGSCCAGAGAAPMAEPTAESASCCGGNAKPASVGLPISSASDEPPVTEPASVSLQVSSMSDRPAAPDGDAAGDAGDASSAGDASCCGSEAERHGQAASPPLAARIHAGLEYAMTNLLDDLAVWILLGLLVAAGITTFVDAETMASWGSGLFAMVLMLLIGLPMYICATGSTPIAAALLIAGVSPGTVLVFLLAGPATNFASLGVIRRELGTTTLAVYLVGLAVSSLCLGLATDAVVAAWNVDVSAQAAAAHQGHLIPTWLAAACAVVLIAFAIRPLRHFAGHYMPTPTPATTA